MQAKEKKILIRNIVLLLILIMTAAFIIINRDALTNKSKWGLYPRPTINEVTNESISLLGNKTVTQQFKAEYGIINHLKFRFINPERDSATGTITLSLMDSKGKIAASTEVNAYIIKHDELTKFILGGDSENANANRIITTIGSADKSNRIHINKGEIYTLVLSSKDVKSKGVFELKVFQGTENATSSHPYCLSIDGEQTDDMWLRGSVCYRKYAIKTFVLFAILILLTAGFILIPFDSPEDETGRRKQKGDGKHAASSNKNSGTRDLEKTGIWLSRIMFILTPVYTYFVIQRFSGIGVKEFLLQACSFKGVLNLFIIGLVAWLFYTLSNSVRFATIATLITGALFGFINYCMVLFRDSPLIATDIAQIKTGLQVVSAYNVSFNGYSLWAILFAVIWCCAAFSLGRHKGLSWRKRLIPVIVLAVWAVSFYYLFFVSSMIKDHQLLVSGFKPNKTYLQNGSALSFVITVSTSKVEKPDGYSPDVVTSLTGKYPSDEAVNSTFSGGAPNIIIVMNESFSDLSVLGEIDTNADYMPYYHSLKDNVIKGWMESSVFGGSTANTEFECLTGLSCKFLPFHSVAYRSLIYDEVPSLAYYFKQIGYGGISAFHPGMVDSYRRNEIYPLLGFDSYQCLDDLNDPEKIRDFVSDKYDYKIVAEDYEAFKTTAPKDQPYFAFNVTIQNHGGFGLSTGEVDAGIVIRDSDMPEDTTKQFVNLMKYSDDALKDLLDYFSEVDEDTIIVFFGDHQPKLDDTFYTTLRAQAENKSLSGIEWATKKQQVPFMIWANYDIEEQDKLQISANYISPYLKSLAGLPKTGLDKYLEELRNTIPVLSAVSYKDMDGKIYDSGSSSKYDEVLNEYGIIQYNALIDKKARVEDFFRLK